MSSPCSVCRKPPSNRTPATGRFRNKTAPVSKSNMVMLPVSCAKTTFPSYAMILVSKTLVIYVVPTQSQTAREINEPNAIVRNQVVFLPAAIP
jgi:hypothetical protein